MPPPSRPLSRPQHGFDGLTADEVAERVAAGQVNKVDDSSSRSLGEVVRDNIFTRFNAIVAALAGP